VLLNQGVDQPVEQIEDIRIAQGGNAMFGYQYHVDRRKIAISMAEHFTAQAFQAIALDRYSRIFFGNNQANPGVTEIVLTTEDSQMARTSLYFSAVENLLEITGFQKSMALCQPEVQNFLPASTIDNQVSRESRSGGQTSPALGSAASKYLATFFGGHSGTKTMGACAFDKAGLKCAFHGNSWNDVSTVFKLLTGFPEYGSQARGRKKEGGFYTV